MASDTAESAKFAFLVLEHNDVLIKSQAADLKQKKVEAVETIIAKWREISGKTLTQQTLYKKINNLKSRAKTALSGGKTLNDWQLKLLEIETTTSDAAENHETSNTISIVTVSDETLGDNASSKSEAEKLLDAYETDPTKGLNNEQLQRLVFLKQVKVLSLQQEHFERLKASASIENGQNIQFDFVNF